MNVLQRLTGLLVFVAALAGAFALSRYFSARPPAPPAADVPPPAPPPTDPLPVRFRARLVTLDFAVGKAHVTLELERDRARPAPEKLWVAASFFSPGGDAQGRCAAEPVEVRRPFAGFGREMVIVELDASRCAAPRTPGATFYARVHVSTTPEAAPADEGGTDDLAQATPVVVQGVRH